ncbi:MAG TPA: site-specific DNA-methyltransferase, partial [Deltaproteobacteria bacterium]|nr:site-specific DNA-methyltransferase [Deltaproteobacteria bacterium]
LEKLRTLLAELFQLDQADLDFGIYRILNQKRADVERFLDEDLLPQVKAAFAKYRPADKAALQAELSDMVANIQSAGMNPDESPKVQALRAQIARGVDLTALEDQVFSDLFTFFRRYYHGGDFLSLRRYKAGVYAIPYEGEEVKLHWANHDQYYIKSSERLSHYAFKVGSRTVRFVLTAASTERDNNKAQSGKGRQFILAREPFMEVHSETLLLRFEYRPVSPKEVYAPKINAKGQQTWPKTVKRVALIEHAIERVLEAVPNDWRSTLNTGAPTKANPKRTILGKHLHQYTARHTFDYFIHKDLGGFLRRELDFFIKNEVLALDDIDRFTDFAHVEEKLSKIRVLRSIAHKLIAFLAQLEDFQKKLWLKKKFVVDTHWCITLDRVPEAFYPQIVANSAQREAWVELFSIDQLEGDSARAGYSEPLTLEFLQSQPSLPVDTSLFDAAFTEQLLATVPNLDAATMGVLASGDNAQALRLFAPRYAGEVTSMFIDPPYNTGEDGFPYKDNYQHSSWLSMMHERLSASHPLLHDAGLIFMAIDFVEVSNLRLLCDQIFGRDNFLADIAWEKRYTRSNNAKRFYSLKDTVLAYRASPAAKVLREPRSEKSKGNYSNPDHDPRGPWISSSYVNPATKEDRPNLVYEIHNPHTGAAVAHPTHAWKYDTTTHQQHVTDQRLYWGLDGGYTFPRLKSFLSEARDGMVPIDVWHHKQTGTTDDGGHNLKAKFGSAVFDNPKPPSLVQRAIQMDALRAGDHLVMDFFAGSGTTGEAVLNLNRDMNAQARFVLVEMGTYFDTVLKPRILKRTYSDTWKDGQPQAGTGASHVIKCIRLEGYEDALNNLQLAPRTEQQQSLLTRSPQLREDYMLSYMLDVETRRSVSLLNIEQFRDPFQYTIEVTQHNESCVRSVDLIETFTYLLGLRVERMHARVHCAADFKRNEHGRLQVQGPLRPCAAGEGWTFRVIEGRTPQARVLVIWRVRTDDPEQDNLMLNAFCASEGFLDPEHSPDVIYVNGDHTLETLREPQASWSVELIERHVHRLMFATTDG